MSDVIKPSKELAIYLFIWLWLFRYLSASSHSPPFFLQPPRPLPLKFKGMHHMQCCRVPDHNAIIVYRKQKQQTKKQFRWFAAWIRCDYVYFVKTFSQLSETEWRNNPSIFGHGPDLKDIASIEYQLYVASLINVVISSSSTWFLDFYLLFPPRWPLTHSFHLHFNYALFSMHKFVPATTTTYQIAYLSTSQKHRF